METPSTLFEYFVWEESFVCQWARHYRTGEPIDARTITRLRESKTMFAALELQQQVGIALDLGAVLDAALAAVLDAALSLTSCLQRAMRLAQVTYAMMDQHYHRSHPSEHDGRWDSTDIFRGLHEKCMPMALVWPEGTHWQCQFGHLVSYGAGYYRYIDPRIRLAASAPNIAPVSWRPVCAHAINPTRAATCTRKSLPRTSGRQALLNSRCVQTPGGNYDTICWRTAGRDPPKYCWMVSGLVIRRSRKPSSNY